MKSIEECVVTAMELIQKYPDKQHLFLGYIRNQEIENDVLENKVVCTTMVIKKK